MITIKIYWLIQYPVLVAENHQFIIIWKIPGIYSNEEIDVLLTPLKEIAAQEGHRDSLFAFFCLRKLHLKTYFRWIYYFT